MTITLSHERLECRFALSAAPVVLAVPASLSGSHQAAHVRRPVQNNLVGVATIHNCLWKGTHILSSVSHNNQHSITAVHHLSR